MAEREKVIRGLECCSGKAIFEARCPFNCPYAVSAGKIWTEPDCCEQLIKDALALLKEQEPRVMTEGEVLHSTGKPIWFESRGMYLSKRGFWILPFEVDSELHIRFVQSVTGGKIIFSLSDYGKVWRAWTSRPSEQQMQDTKWEVELI